MSKMKKKKNKFGNYLVCAVHRDKNKRLLFFDTQVTILDVTDISPVFWCHDTQHNDTQHNHTQHTDTPHNHK